MPTIHINWIAILVAVVANFIIGFVWYGPLFGKRWGKEHGYDMNVKPPASEMMKGMIFMIIGSFFMAWVFSHNIAAWDPRSWGQEASPASPAVSAIMAGVFTWLGFFFPVDLGRVAWERKSWTLFFIDTLYHLISLIVMALILVYMH
jgi:hypothetical protein